MVKQERAARTRQSLVRAAAEVFAQEGFVPASLTTISKRAGVSNGALHFHFESKQTLARAVEDEAAKVVRAITEGADDVGFDALQRLVDATHDLMSRLSKDVVVRAGFELSGEAPLRDQGVDLRAQWRSWVEKVLIEAERQENLAEGVTATDATVAVVAATVGLEHLGASDRSWISQATLVQFWDLLLPRLASPDTLRRLQSGGTRA
ncbi:ScbR family autoregulator-binding transcription factor [Streptomyces monticola]|uniref:ScbR family autoregulator-binding transcription factor n=1 Tax=Streptomyces monticola TaxID=2666263 RepID=A0ABW2JXJ6_9ACTN